MNFIPKEIKEALDNFKKSFRKLFFTTSSTSEINYSRVLENKKECTCNTASCIKDCPNIPMVEVDLNLNIFEDKQELLLSIKSLNVLTTIKNSLFCLSMYLEKENKNIILFKGLISDFIINKTNYSFPLKLNIPNKIVFKIFLLDPTGNKIFSQTDNILQMGVIDFGLTFL